MYEVAWEDIGKTTAMDNYITAHIIPTSWRTGNDGIYFTKDKIHGIKTVLFPSREYYVEWLLKWS